MNNYTYTIGATEEVFFTCRYCQGNARYRFRLKTTWPAWEDKTKKIGHPSGESSETIAICSEECKALWLFERNVV